MFYKTKMTHYLLASQFAIAGCLFAPNIMANEVAAPVAEASTEVSADVSDVEVAASSVLEQMSTYLASQQKFEITAHTSIESMLDSGQKIMLDSTSRVAVQRPNKLFSTRQGNIIDQNFYYDGRSLTLYNNKAKVFATVAAPDTVSKTLDYTLAEFKLIAPGIDLLHTDIATRLSKGLLSGFYAGKAMIAGVECHHLAFRNEEVDWQIWVQTGDQPLPKKYIITSRWTTGAPQYSITMDWNLKPSFNDSLFNFSAPSDAKKVEIQAALPDAP
ncbi:MAG: DUF2092 domain-containing protein [Methyloprofundus sp.]|nr:DUF2092 domain-containing protein [Methyloprofundus sp.]